MSLSRPALETLFAQAKALLTKGAVQSALQVARQVLAVEPNNPDIVNLLGVCAISLGDRNAAEQCWLRAIELQPGAVEARYNLAVHYMETGQSALAEQYFRQTVALDPAHGAAFARLGIVLASAGCTVDAEQCYRQALVIDPQDAASCNNLALLLAAQKRDAEAEQFFRTALSMAPDDAKTHSNLGVLLARGKRYTEAEQCYRQALSLNPSSAEAYTNLGLLLASRKDFAQAEQCHNIALSLAPESAEIHVNLANFLASQERTEEAEHVYRQAIVLQPDSAAALSNYGVLLAYACRDEEAEQCFRQALAVTPDYQLARLNLAMLLLAQGRLEEGWRYHEARYHLDLPDPDAPLPTLPYRQWQGESLIGKSLLVWPEQGHGDLIQFCRYLPLLKEQGTAHITLVCRPTLVELMRTLAGVDRVVSLDDLGSLQDHVDYWTLPMSLPLHCHTTLATIPIRIPYLQAPAARLAAWSSRLPPSMGKLRVGLVWRGNPMHANDAKRSLPGLSALAALWAIPCVQYFSLQVGTSVVTDASEVGEIVDLGSQIGDFADTAAILQHLDLLITVDTAVAHLAGALGTPCWVMLPAYRTDWRWLRERTDSPWYPDTMRLFRQAPQQDWGAVVAQVAAALAEHARPPG
jgi:Flp pilus assembly protein TadD